MCTEGGGFDIVICRVVAVVAVVVLVLMFVAKEKIALWMDGHLWSKLKIRLLSVYLLYEGGRDKGKRGIEQLYQLLNNLFGVDCLVSK